MKFRIKESKLILYQKHFQMANKKLWMVRASSHQTSSLLKLTSIISPTQSDYNHQYCKPSSKGYYNANGYQRIIRPIPTLGEG